MQIRVCFRYFVNDCRHLEEVSESIKFVNEPFEEFEVGQKPKAKRNSKIKICHP